MITKTTQGRKMIITVGALKGGCGKTSTAFNLAVMAAKDGRSVLVCDADTNENLYSLSLLREHQLGDPGFAVVKHFGRDIRRQLQRQRNKWELIVIDAGKEGRDTSSLKAALSISDVLLTPVTPRSLDVMLLEELYKTHIAEAKEYHNNRNLHCYTFLSKADTEGGAENRETTEFLKSEPFPNSQYIDAPIFERKPVVKAQSQGLTIFEYANKSQASSIKKGREELEKLTAEVFKGIETAGDAFRTIERVTSNCAQVTQLGEIPRWGGANAPEIEQQNLIGKDSWR